MQLGSAWGLSLRIRNATMTAWSMPGESVFDSAVERALRLAPHLLPQVGQSNWWRQSWSSTTRCDKGTIQHFSVTALNRAPTPESPIQPIPMKSTYPGIGGELHTRASVPSTGTNITCAILLRVRAYTSLRGAMW